MPKNETKLKKLTKNQESLKKLLRYGDIKQLAEVTGYSISTVYQVLRGQIQKIDIWNALAKIVGERRKQEKKLDETIKNTIR
jgi:predicted transcriptional regulator